MKRRDLVLAALSPADGGPHSPVQVQKLMFLIDDRLSSKIDAERFAFQPYDYGPFDKEVYDELEALEAEGLVTICHDARFSLYRLTQAGQKAGKEALASLDKKYAKYIEQLSEFVRSLSFSELVSAIYKAYPAMKENSVFQS